MVSDYFPDALPVEDYLDRTRAALVPHGMASGKTRAMVVVCREMPAAALDEPVRALWGPPVVMAAMGGMVVFGPYGLREALAHAQGADGRQRFVVYAMAHIGIDADGVIGFVNSPGQDRRVPACGALMAFRNELDAGTVNRNPHLDPSDLEMSLLRQRLLREIPDDEVPGPVEITTLARQVILQDLMRTAMAVREWEDADVAVFTGIQIHTPEGDLIAPAHSSVRRADQEHTRLEL